MTTVQPPAPPAGRPGRAAAAVAAMVALSGTTAVALTTGTAAAWEAGRCPVGLNVRAEPDVSARIVALCAAGTVVQLGARRNGFVHLVDLGGWAAQEYVEAGGAPAPAELVVIPCGARRS